MLNAPSPPLENLDSHRIAWELIPDWDKYQAFGIGRTAVVQFSRGCPHRCTYCGQWPFWQRWRHRDVTRFVDELEFLHGEHEVQFFWFADENPTTDKQSGMPLLEEIGRRSMATGMTCSIRSQDIVRDADILDLYRQAGFLYVLMGVETVTDETLRKVRKESSVSDAYQAVWLLRKHGILSIIDYIFGLEEETPGRSGGPFAAFTATTATSSTPLPYAVRLDGHGAGNAGRGDRRGRPEEMGLPSPGGRPKGFRRAQLFLGAKLVEASTTCTPRVWRAATATDDACGGISASPIGTSSVFSGMKLASSCEMAGGLRKFADFPAPRRKAVYFDAQHAGDDATASCPARVKCRPSIVPPVMLNTSVRQRLGNSVAPYFAASSRWRGRRPF